MKDAAFCSRCEFSPLRSVLLHKPGPEVGAVEHPAEVLYERAISYPLLEEEYRRLAETFAGLGVAVHWIRPLLVEGEDARLLYNLMYARDLFFMTPAGAVMSRMASPIRRGEVPHARQALERIGAPVVGAIQGGATFEGADALWVTEQLVAVAVGNRTNHEGFAQLREILSAAGVDCVALPPAQRTQHLLGAVQFVDRRRALVRPAIAPAPAIALLQDRGFDIIRVPESAEVRERQAMNIVALAPGKILMPSDCPATKELYAAAGLAITEAPANQLAHGGGGLACAAGILQRAPA
jgi:N-dimethylarginine dimethylaminohydrolase